MIFANWITHLCDIEIKKTIVYNSLQLSEF